MEQQNQCVIIASRPVSAGMRRFLPPGAFVIAADAGWRGAQALGVAVDLAVGDFDSVPPPAGARELMRLPAEKDDTDTHFAAREALRRGFHDVTLLGALGGRLDHTLANLQTLLFLAQSGARCLAADEANEIHCFGPGRHEVSAVAGRWMSVFAAGGETKGVCLTGVKYPLKDATLTASFPVGVSNEITGAAAGVACSSGWLYVMLSGEEG